MLILHNVIIYVVLQDFWTLGVFMSVIACVCVHVEADGVWCLAQTCHHLLTHKSNKTCSYWLKAVGTITRRTEKEVLIESIWDKWAVNSVLWTFIGLYSSHCVETYDVWTNLCLIHDTIVWHQSCDLVANDESVSAAWKQEPIR